MAVPVEQLGPKAPEVRVAVSTDRGDVVVPLMDAAMLARADREAILAVAKQVGRLTELYEAMAALLPNLNTLSGLEVLDEARAQVRVERARRIEQRRQGLLVWPYALNAMDEARSAGGVGGGA